MTITSLFINEPQDVYHSKSKNGEYMASHLLDDFQKSPKLYWDKINGRVEEVDKPAWAVGRAAHCLILEGEEAFLDKYLIGGPINPRTGNPYGVGTKAHDEWIEKNGGLPTISEETWDDIRIWRDSVFAHKEAAFLLSSGNPEQVCRSNVSGVPCQARIDWVTNDMSIIDLKTCSDITVFEWDARIYHYANQMAFYHDVIESHPDSTPIRGVYMIVAEKNPPYATGVWVLSKEALNEASRTNTMLLNTYKTCKETGLWPTGYEDIRVLRGVNE